jgi:hypothetical protein
MFHMCLWACMPVRVSLGTLDLEDPLLRMHDLMLKMIPQRLINTPAIEAVACWFAGLWSPGPDLHEHAATSWVWSTIGTPWELDTGHCLATYLDPQ